MKRVIEFRGQVIGGIGRWVYGSLLQNQSGTCCIVDKNTFPNKIGEQYLEVVHVGQYTGLLDKNGKKIFEGDIIKGEQYETLHIVFYNDKTASFQCKVIGYDDENGCDVYQDWIDTFQKIVIGNVFDNPKLLEES